MSTPDDAGAAADVSIDNFNATKLREALITDGFAVAKAIVPEPIVDAMRDTWLRAYADNIKQAPVIWGPFLGEANRILFHRSDSCCMYRAYDFLWNRPIDVTTRSIGLKLHRLRNCVAESQSLDGELIREDRYGIYITTSYYPPNYGWLAEHRDHADGRRHWHFMLLMTMKKKSYEDGGLFLINRSGTKTDIDSLVRPGDVIFFDGTLPHGVEPVSGGAGLGRLQMFSIPTFMETPQKNDRLLEDITFKRFFRAKLRPIKRKLIGFKRSSGGIY
ncbi:MAG: hypothetical protein CBB68_07020 [Rhodospirillaceae bacterium TMED8]|nr:hypothetical protein [Magnetovibrio sp.]OUT50745.1 MAG: hypothetical protein CBB68_07020 [Rhodospirillaceae bacterium TMED8]